MGSFACCSCRKIYNNLGQVNIGSQPEQGIDQYMHGETKTGFINSNITKEKKINFKIDKSDFVRMKDRCLFDEYDLIKKLGEGAYGCVYKIQQKTTNYLRAVKALKRKEVDEEEFTNEI